MFVCTNYKPKKKFCLPYFKKIKITFWNPSNQFHLCSNRPTLDKLEVDCSKTEQERHQKKKEQKNNSETG
jgi:hypothetical protein